MNPKSKPNPLTDAGVASVSAVQYVINQGQWRQYASKCVCAYGLCSV